MAKGLAFFVGCCLILGLSFATYATVYAQSSPADPGQDPFALTPDKLSLFGASASASLNSLFDGDSQKANGLFATPDTQLGGAAPYSELIAPERTNADQPGPTFIVLTSKYTPQGDLTSDSTITLTVTVKNTGNNTANGITLHATLQDKNAALVASAAPNPAMTTDSSIDTELVWDQLGVGHPFNLAAGASASFSWSFKANKDDTILRWRLVANYGASESILLQWIPIKNPNPQAAGPGSGGSSSGGSFSNPCSTTGGSGPFPDSSSNADIIPLFKQHWNITLKNSGADYTNEKFHGMLKAWWEVLTTVECTPYLTDAFPNGLTIEGTDTGEWWWGWYIGNYVQEMNINNIANGTVAHIKQNLIHELGHVYEGTDPHNLRPEWEANYCNHGSPSPNISGYGDTNCNEDFAETMGYYVERDSNEWGAGDPPYCATKNPFDWGQSAYYEFAKTKVFGGKEYGPAAPSSPTSC